MVYHDASNPIEIHESYAAKGFSKKDGPFIVAIIDGHKAIFHDTLVGEGFDGGVKAADLFHTEVYTHFKESLKLMVRIFGNKSTLASQYKQRGAIQDDKTYRDFIKGLASRSAKGQNHITFFHVESEDPACWVRQSFQAHKYLDNCDYFILGCGNDKYLKEDVKDERHIERDGSVQWAVQVRLLLPGDTFTGLGLQRFLFKTVFKQDTTSDPYDEDSDEYGWSDVDDESNDTALSVPELSDG